MYYKKIVAISLSLIFATAISAAEGPQTVLRICADPYMLPFSNRHLEGYENKIAALFAEALEMEVKYAFFPQRMGFIRNTLRAELDEGGYKCDLVMSVPSGFELAMTTIPYYRSSYMLVFDRAKRLAPLKEAEALAQFVEDHKLPLRIGITDRGPGQLWVFYQELMQYMTPYLGHPGDPRLDPGHSLIKAVVEGELDAAIVWGPTAGYYAKVYQDQAMLTLLPLKDDVKKNRQMRFSYDLSMAVRYGEQDWLETINGLIKKKRTQIQQILLDYGIPLVE